MRIGIIHESLTLVWTSHLKEEFLFGRREAVALLDSRVAFQEGAGGDAAGDPLNRHHVTPAAQQSVVRGLLHKRRPYTWRRTGSTAGAMTQDRRQSMVQQASWHNKETWTSTCPVSL